MKKELLESILEAPGYLAAAMAKPAGASEGRQRDVVFYSGAKVERFDWFTGEMYDLSFEMGGADLSRLIGGPVLNGHASYSVDDVLGRVDAASRASGGYVASLAFSVADSVNDAWQKIEDGTLNAVSMGVKIDKLVLQEADKKNKRKHYMATAWQPFEVSVVPIGADPGARFLSMDPRLERLRAIESSASSVAAKEAEDLAARARIAMAIKARRLRVLGC